jgi:hypothetical protein
MHTLHEFDRHLYHTAVLDANYDCYRDVTKIPALQRLVESSLANRPVRIPMEVVDFRYA